MGVSKIIKGPKKTPHGPVQGTCVARGHDRAGEKREARNERGRGPEPSMWQSARHRAQHVTLASGRTPQNDDYGRRWYVAPTWGGVSKTGTLGTPP